LILKLVDLEFEVLILSFLEGANMFRFDRLIRRDMLIRDVKQQHPATIEVFEEFGFRTTCDDCDIETVARKNGLDSRDVVERLNRAAFGTRTGIEENAGY
jgi:hypothetical protein